MGFRNQKPKQRPSHNDRNKPARRHNRQQFGRHAQKKTSFLSSLKKIALPAALVGAFAAMALSNDFSIDRLIEELRSRNTASQVDSGVHVDQSDEGAPTARLNGMPDLVCRNVKVTDGDTLRCGDTRIRLEGIDSPEMGGKCRAGRKCVDGDPDAAKANLQRLVSRGPLECTKSDTDHYGRMIARCVVAKVDLSCEQIRTGHAVERYSKINC